MKLAHRVDGDIQLATRALDRFLTDGGKRFSNHLYREAQDGPGGGGRRLEPVTLKPVMDALRPLDLEPHPDDLVADPDKPHPNDINPDIDDPDPEDPHAAA